MINAHEKRVTLNLARHSAAAAQVPGLVTALNNLAGCDWEMEKLQQVDVEIIYATFDAAFEAQIKDEFEADANFLIDHKDCQHTCPLCGHFGIRFEFRINSTKGGQSVDCGSDCIITHGLHVKGTETAEAARQVLEAAIRKQIRKCQIAAWHTTTGFSADQFETARSALWAIRSGNGHDYHERMQARYFQKEVAKLEKFYGTSGWLGTESKWASWTKAVQFIRARKTTSLEMPMSFAKAMGKDEATVPVEVVVAPAPAPVVVEAPKEEPKPAAFIGAQLDLFAGVTQALVFGGSK